MEPHPLTPIENDIIVEICKFLALRGDGSAETLDVIGILGCWGDSLPEEDVLSLLQAVNAHCDGRFGRLRARKPNSPVE
jgi:hypothetical protein